MHDGESSPDHQGCLRPVSPSSNVHQAFSSALSDTLAMQDTIYKQMQQRGWYTTEQAQQQKLDQIKQKYTTATN